MNEFWNEYYSTLEGATILKFEPMIDENEDIEFPSFLVEFANGEVGHIEISQDPEGNGPGFIFGLPIHGPKLYVVGD